MPTVTIVSMPPADASPAQKITAISAQDPHFPETYREIDDIVKLLVLRSRRPTSSNTEVGAADDKLRCVEHDPAKGVPECDAGLAARAMAGSDGGDIQNSGIDLRAVSEISYRHRVALTSGCRHDNGPQPPR